MKDLGSWDAWLATINDVATVSRTEIEKGYTATSDKLRTIVDPFLRTHASQLSNWVKHAQILHDIFSLERIMESIEFKIFEAISQNEMLSYIHSIVCDFLQDQVLFKTCRGEKLGMAPHSIRAGDQIALISGLRFPMVVRPQANGNFRLITPAYIVRVMYGEEWNEEELQDIVVD